MPLSAEQQCFYVAILAFIVVGFQRGWRRELVSLVFVLLGVFLVNPTTSRGVANFFALLPSVLSYLFTAGKSGPPSASPVNDTIFTSSIGTLLIFGVIVGLGYYIGNRVFPKPALPQDRFIGVIPGVISGAFVIGYLSNYFPRDTQGRPSLTLNLQLLDPGNYIPILFAIAVVALVVALIAARAKKTAKK